MSLYSIFCGNFHQLRNSIGSCSSTSLLKCGLIYRTVLQNRGNKTRPISTTILARSTRKESKQSFKTSRHLHSESVESSIEVLKQSDLEHLKSLQCYNIPQKVSGVKTDWPATILVFDIETTGFSRRYERIIEFAVRDLMGGKNSTIQTLINPEREIKNAYVHGISSSMVCKPDIPRYDIFNRCSVDIVKLFLLMQTVLFMQ